MKVFAFPGYERFGGISASPFHAGRFPNGEWHIELDEDVAGESCRIIGSVSPPDEQLLLTTLLADTLKNQGAKRIEGLFPYLAYCRQDKVRPKESLSSSWLGGVLRASGIESVTTFDIHSASAAELLGMPVRSLSPAPLLADFISREVGGRFTLVSPDRGAIRRCEAVRDALGLSEPISFLIKKRTEQGIVAELQGETRERAIIVDDILDTGATLVACARELRKAGARELYVIATHGLFTGEKWQELWELGVVRICCTNSVSGTIPSDARICVLDIAELVPQRCAD